MTQLEGRATKIYNYVQGGFGETKQEKKKDWQQLLAQVPIFKKKKIMLEKYAQDQMNNDHLQY